MSDYRLPEEERGRRRALRSDLTTGLIWGLAIGFICGLAVAGW